MKSANYKILIIIPFVYHIDLLAYLGPGMSGGVLAAIVGFFTAIFLGLWAILYYPIKRFIKNRKKSYDKK